MLMVQFRYQRQKKVCVDVSEGNPDYVKYTWTTPARRWKINNFTSGNYLATNNPGWTCNRDYVSRLESAVTVAKSSSLTWREMFELAGVKLDAWQRSGEYNKWTIGPRADYQYTWICGYGADPTSANRVKEVNP
jgi:hypothetical protein